MTKNSDEMAFESWWQDQYGKAMEFRDWQSCDNLHTAKSWQRDGFISGINYERKRSEKLLKMCELTLENIDFMLEVHKPKEMEVESKPISFDVWQKFYLQRKKLKQTLRTTRRIYEYVPSLF